MKILKHAHLVQFQPASVQENMDIAIDGTTIAEVGQNLAAHDPDAEVNNLNGAMVTPGIVCSHNHFYSGLARGILATITPCPDFV